ncbi:MAG: class B sortase [Anaerolineaceae bacterium]
MSDLPPEQVAKHLPWRQIIKWVIIVLVLAMILIMAIIIRNEWSYKKGNETYANINRQVVTTPETTSSDSPWIIEATQPFEEYDLTPGSTQPTPSPLTPQEPTPLIDNAMDLARIRSLVNVDFDSLKAINTEVEAWVFSEDSPISYPIVRGENNERYLSQLIDGSKNPLGSLFVDYRNQAGFKDENTLVYGHNMEDDSMLATLPEYKHQEYYNKHPNLYLFLPNQTYRVELIGGFDLDPEDLGLLQFNFASPRDHDDFTFQVRTRSWFRSRIETTSSDRFVTLLTCNYETDEGRFALVGRLVPLE